jgi:hypothetical protein
VLITPLGQAQLIVSSGVQPVAALLWSRVLPASPQAAEITIAAMAVSFRDIDTQSAWRSRRGH